MKQNAISAEAKLLLYSYGLTLGLYQTTRLPEAVQSLLQQQAELHILQRDFATELVSAITYLWLGSVQKA